MTQLILDSQVMVAFSLVAFIWAISIVLQLKIGDLLAIASLRCTAQLIAVTFVLRYIFPVTAESMWAVARRFPTVFLQERGAH